MCIPISGDCRAVAQVPRCHARPTDGLWESGTYIAASMGPGTSGRSDICDPVVKYIGQTDKSARRSRAGLSEHPRCGVDRLRSGGCRAMSSTSSKTELFQQRQTRRGLVKRGAAVAGGAAASVAAPAFLRHADATTGCAAQN